MTQQEIETELNTLRELVLRQQQQEEARRKNWRSISKSATILAVTMCVGALELLVFGFVLRFWLSVLQHQVSRGVGPAARFCVLALVPS